MELLIAVAVAVVTMGDENVSCGDLSSIVVVNNDDDDDDDDCCCDEKELVALEEGICTKELETCEAQASNASTRESLICTIR